MKESQSITAEEILNTLLLFFIKKPKGLLILGIIVAFMVSFMYVSYIRSQNEILISSLSVLKDMSVIVDNAQKRSNQIEKTTNDVLETANKATDDINKRLVALEEVERRFQEKREYIQKLREENDRLLADLKNAVEEAKENLGRISEQREKAEKKVNEIDVQQKILKGIIK